MMASRNLSSVLSLGSYPDGDPRARSVRHLRTRHTPRRFATKAQWLARAAELRQHILVSCGLWPPPPKTPLKPRIFGRLNRDGYTIEKVYFESIPNLFVTGNLYRPRGGEPPFPGVLCPHGHWPKGRLHHDKRGSIPARCITLARQGYVAFSYDMVGYNDARQVKHTFGGKRRQLWSISLMGLQLWNSVRCVDFLQSLPDVDPTRIACTGASGGGTQTFLLMAVDDRLVAAAPVCMISAHFQGGCLCENAPNLRVDTNNVEIASLFAPRPLSLVAATGDWTCENPDVEYPAIRAVYRLLKAEDKVASVRFEAEHNYNRDSREAVYAWFGRWLLGDRNPQHFKEEPLAVEKPQTLRVFSNRRKRPRSAVNDAALTQYLIQQHRRRINDLQPTDRKGLRRLRETLGVALAHSLGLGCARRGKTLAESLGSSRPRGLVIDKLLIGRAGATHKIPALLLVPKTSRPKASSVLAIHHAGKAALFVAESQQRPADLLQGLLDRGHKVLVIDCFNTGELMAPHKRERSQRNLAYFTTYNCTQTALRVQDIVLALDYLRSCRDAGTIKLLGLGSAGPWALLAAPFAPRLARVAIDLARFDPSREDHWLRRLFVPGILHAGGLDTAASLLAPTPLLIHNLGEGFAPHRIADAYAAAGAADRFRTQGPKMSETQLVEWIAARR